MARKILKVDDERHIVRTRTEARQRPTEETAITDAAERLGVRFWR